MVAPYYCCGHQWLFIRGQFREALAASQELRHFYTRLDIPFLVLGHTLARFGDPRLHPNAFRIFLSSARVGLSQTV